MTKRLAIIPARGGSKRIPHKNIRDFCGLPMIAHVLSTARESRLFDVIHVSTESPDIRAVVERLGMAIDFPRPAELADDYTPLMPVLKYVVDTYAKRGKAFDEVWLLMACAPLLQAPDLVDAAKLFERSGRSDPMLSVTEYPSPVEWAFSRSADGKLTPLQQGMFAVRSQDLEKRYYDAGLFAAYSSKAVLEAEGAGSDAGFIGYVLPKSRAIDIDDEDDWALAESMYRARRIG